jgi:lipoprotein-anchoring transpeptidase ErfK/SrfK
MPATLLPEAPPLVSTPGKGDRVGPPQGPVSGPSTGPTPAPSGPLGGQEATLGPPVSPDGAGAAPANGPAPRVGKAGDAGRNPTTPPPGDGADSGTERASNDSEVKKAFADFMANAQKSLDEGKLAETHLVLSKVYLDPKLPAEQAKQIAGLLDELAGTVIYSPQHYLEPAYVVQPGDTIDKVARNYDVPWQLLAKINGLMRPDSPNTNEALKDRPLRPGTEVKVVRGPFDAVVHLDKRELTLILQGRYAGRFKIGIGRDQPKLEGEYTVCIKAPDPIYYGPDGVTIGAGDPKNPLGAAWIGLTERIGIHGTNDPQNIGRDDNRGYICLGARDLQDLYGILTVGSRVSVMR